VARGQPRCTEYSTGQKSSSYTSSMSSSQQKSAISQAGGTGRTSWGGGKSGNRWTLGGSTTKGGSTLYRGNGRAYSSRPRYYGHGAHTSSSYQAMSYTKKAIVWGAVAGVGAFAFYQYSSSRRDCDSYYFAYGSGCRSCRYMTHVRLTRLVWASARARDWRSCTCGPASRS